LLKITGGYYDTIGKVKFLPGGREKGIFMSEAVEHLGWIGFLLFAGTLLPFVTRRLRPGPNRTTFFSRQHRFLAVGSLGVLTLHGLLALLARGGRGGGFREDVLTGVLAWLLLLAVVLLAFRAFQQSPFRKTHCWLTAVLVLAVLGHI